MTTVVIILFKCNIVTYILYGIDVDQLEMNFILILNASVLFYSIASYSYI